MIIPDFILLLKRIITGFHPRAHRICSHQYSHEEEKHIANTFKAPPNYFMFNAKQNAHKTLPNGREDHSDKSQKPKDIILKSNAKCF